jgi:hypothetical protein
MILHTGWIRPCLLFVSFGHTNLQAMFYRPSIVDIGLFCRAGESSHVVGQVIESFVADPSPQLIFSYNV